MEKNKYADLALILALISLVSPVLAILTSQGIIPRILIFGSLAVSGTGLMGLILGIIGYNETDHKWKSIAAIVIYVVGTVVYLILAFSVMYDVIWGMFSDLLPY
jgi:spore maturation protein SpmB